MSPEHLRVILVVYSSALLPLLILPLLQRRHSAPKLLTPPLKPSNSVDLCASDGECVSICISIAGLLRAYSEGQNEGYAAPPLGLGFDAGCHCRLQRFSLSSVGTQRKP